MITFTATILKFNNQGEKTGWTYINISPEFAQQLLPENKKSFRVKGKLDECEIKGIALLPMGEGNFIMPLNTAIRKLIGKTKGALLKVQLSFDKEPYQLNETLLSCLEEEPAAREYLKSLLISHQNYFSKWIDAAETQNPLKQSELQWL